MNVCVNENDINECLKNLEKNKRYLNIDDNLFLIGNILTVNGLEYDFDTSFKNVYFQFSYDDGIKKEIISIKYYYHFSDCYTFVTENKILPDDIINEIRDEVIKKSRSTMDFVRDKDFYDLVLNKVEDKDVFIKQYDIYIEKEKKKASDANDLMSKLCKKIIEIKFNN